MDTMAAVNKLKALRTRRTMISAAPLSLLVLAWISSAISFALNELIIVSPCGFTAWQFPYLIGFYAFTLRVPPERVPLCGRAPSPELSTLWTRPGNHIGRSGRKCVGRAILLVIRRDGRSCRHAVGRQPR